MEVDSTSDMDPAPSAIVPQDQELPSVGEIPAPEGQPAEVDEEESGEQAGGEWTTRCPCGNNEETGGFMILCDLCGVWQHGDCVGIYDDEVPDHYKCDLCDPEGYKERQAHAKSIGRKLGQGNRRGSNTKPNRGTRRGGRGAIRKNSSDFPHQGSEIPHEVNSSTYSVPGLNDPSGSGHNLSREERKLQNIMRQISHLEGSATHSKNPSNKSSKSRKGNSSSSIPSTNNNPHMQNQSSHSSKSNSRKRRNSRASSLSQDDLIDLDLLKSSPHILKHFFPMSPMYLGKKVWLMQVIQEKDEANSSSRSEGQAPNQDSSDILHAPNISFKKRLLKHDQSSSRDPAATDEMQVDETMQS